jgi:alcohol dehydrogenase
MQQLTFLSAGHLEWREVPAPTLQLTGQAIVRPIAVATCDLDAALIRGQAPFAGPFAFGHEFIAEVLEVGEAVQRVAPGQLVIVPFQISCGTCARCQRGQTEVYPDVKTAPGRS